MNRAKRIVFVSPRFGEGLGGGAEQLIASLVGLYADHVAAAGFDPGEFVEVYTTTARDHRSWQNYFPAGRETVRGVTVNRFTVDDRKLDIFIRAELDMQAGKPLTIGEQLDWLQSGVNSTDLYSALHQNLKSFDLVVLAPYLFPITFFGGLIAGRKAVVVPCLHDEHYAYQEVFASFFGKIGGIIFNSEPEKELFSRVFPGMIPPLGTSVVGVPIESQRSSATSVANPLDGKLYLSYCGRKERGKGLDVLIDYFSRSRHSWEAEIELALIGSGEIDFLDKLPPGVIDLGYLSEEGKLAVIGGSIALCQPSLNESFSIVLMEAWAQGTPVLVNGRSAVTRSHVEQSGGGLYFESAAEFFITVKRLLEDRELSRQLGEAGRSYVESEYSRQAVSDRLVEAISKFTVSGTSVMANEFRG